MLIIGDWNTNTGNKIAFGIKEKNGPRIRNEAEKSAVKSLSLSLNHCKWTLPDGNTKNKLIIYTASKD